MAIRKPSIPERILSEMIQELPEEIVESTKEYLKNPIAVPEGREELGGLQSRVVMKTGLSDFLFGWEEGNPELQEREREWGLQLYI